MRVSDPLRSAPVLTAFQDPAPLPPDLIPYGPATWGPTQWLAVAGYVVLFLVFLWLIARIARPRVPSEVMSEEEER